MLNSDLASQEQASESISSNRASPTERRSKILFPNQSSSSARSPSHQHSLTLEIKELNGWWLSSSPLWIGCFFCLLLNAFMITDGLICQKWAFCWSLKCSKSYCCTFLQGFPHYVSKITLHHNFQQICTKHYFSFLLYSPRWKAKKNYATMNLIQQVGNYLPLFLKRLSNMWYCLCKLEMEGLVCPALDSSSPSILLL